MERLPGVKRAEVTFERRQARITFEDTLQTPEKLVAAIDKLGFKASLLSVTASPTSESPAKR